MCCNHFISCLYDENRPVLSFELILSILSRILMKLCRFFVGMMNRKIVQTSFFGSKVVLDYQSKAEI